MGTAMIPISIALLVLVLWSVRRLGALVLREPEALRKCVHVALGLYCLSFPLIFEETWQVATVCGIAILLMLALRIGRARSEGLGSVLHGVGRESYGEILFAASVALLFHLKGERDILYLLPIATLTLADAAAAIVGSQYGRRIFHIEDGTKSFEGTTIFFLLAWLISTGMLLHFSDVPRENVLLLGLVIAGFGTLIEAECWRGLDNLFVPLGLYFFLMRYLDASVLDVAYAAGVLCFITIGASLLVARMGADAHAARVAVIAIFCIWMTADAVNVATPLAALAAFVQLERHRPSADRHPYLRAVLAMIGVALLWFTIGETLGFNAIFLFHASFGLVAAGAVGLCADGPRKLLLVQLAWGIATIRLWTADPFEADHMIYGCVLLAAMLALAFAAPHLRGLLERRRALRLASVGVGGGALFLPLLPL